MLGRSGFLATRRDMAGIHLRQKLVRKLSRLRDRDMPQWIAEG